MTITSLRKKNVDEIKKEVINLSKTLFNLRMKKSSQNLSNSAEFRQIRKQIARAKTVCVEYGESK
jgi:large subunit ribosomal protein L29